MPRTSRQKHKSKAREQEKRSARRAAKPAMRRVCIVKARCIQCKAIRVVSEDEVPKGHMPMCKQCFGILVAISATSKLVPVTENTCKESEGT